jgi:hypothetical protein
MGEERLGYRFASGASLLERDMIEEGETASQIPNGRCILADVKIAPERR